MRIEQAAIYALRGCDWTDGQDTLRPRPAGKILCAWSDRACLGSCLILTVINGANQNHLNGSQRTQSRAAQLATERDGQLPVWVRAPKCGHEFYSGCSRAKLYEWAGKGFIRSVSIREPGQIKGVRLFHLASILAFIERCEAGQFEPDGRAPVLKFRFIAENSAPSVTTRPPDAPETGT